MKSILRKCILAVAGILAVSAGAYAQQRQDWAVKTNLLYDAALTVNAGIERRVAPHWSVDLSGNINAWSVRDHKWRHWMVQPEARFWLCEAIGGSFFAFHALGGQYNVSNVDLGFKMLGTNLRAPKDRRYQGWYAGLGAGYGYSWMLSRHWNIEAEIAIGWIYTRYDVYPCTECGRRMVSNKPHNYVGPTKAALNLVYVF